MVIEMPKHEFGIMNICPKKGEIYDQYEPERFNCISVDDDYILPLLKKMNEVKFYWHTLERPELGLAYYGITIIPPESLDSIIEMILDNKNLTELLILLSKAQDENKFVIHFGI